jgi:hypothetical protein
VQPLDIQLRLNLQGLHQHLCNHEEDLLTAVLNAVFVVHANPQKQIIAPTPPYIPLAAASLTGAK